MRDRFGAKNPRSELLRFHTQTAGSTLTAQQPENNVTRVALQALAAVLGGTQSLHTNSMDEALSLPTEHAVRIALRTQQILAEESGVANTIDPLAGSFYVEHLTDEIERHVLAYLQQIDTIGGALEAIQSGFMQQEINESAYRDQQEIERGDQVVVGLNAYQSDQPLALKRLKVDPRIEQDQRKRLASLRAKRDTTQIKSLLNRLGEVAQGEENLMPPLIECVEADITLGEICGVLREQWGEYQQTVTI
jgi:methylmalonyl-CoA mutase N-terminal domain/subunit